MTLNRDLLKEVTIKGDNNPYGGVYTSVDPINTSSYAYFKYQDEKKYNGTINDQNIWQPFPHFTVVGRGNDPFPNQEFSRFHIPCLKT